MFRIAGLLGTVLFISGCMVKPYVLTQDDVQTRVAKDLETVSALQEPLSGPIDLYEAIARALKYNLDAKVKTMQAQLAHQQLNVAHYTLLPQLSANAGSMAATRIAVAVHNRCLTVAPVLEPFTSSDKNVVSGNLALSWDVLDFGLSFVRAQQAADNVMIAEEERRRIAVRLVQDVRSAYWRAISAERVLARVKFLDESVNTALERAQQIVDKLQTP